MAQLTATLYRHRQKPQGWMQRSMPRIMSVELCRYGKLYTLCRELGCTGTYGST